MKKLILTILVLLLPISFPERILAQNSAQNTKEEIKAFSYLAVNLSDGSIILEKNKDLQYIPASLVKLMTAVIVFENIDLNKTIILTKKMLSPLGWSPALYLGKKISSKDLLKASLIQSSNDAAFALTFFLLEGEFLKLMNKKAKDLEMNNTVFYDSFGMSILNRTTAYEFSKLLAYIYKNHPQILEISKDNNFWLPGPNGKLMKFKNLNIFYSLPEFLGGKTGYLPLPIHNLASIFIVKEKPIAIIILSSENSKNTQNDILKILDLLKTNLLI